MSLQKLARELDETARQTAALVDAVGEALTTLANQQLSADFARQEAIALIVSALQGQDRIEQRCQNMALAVRQFALLPPPRPIPSTMRSGQTWCWTNYGCRRFPASLPAPTTARSNCSRVGSAKVDSTFAVRSRDQSRT